MVTRAELTSIETDDLQNFKNNIQVPPEKLDVNFNVVKAKYNTLQTFVKDDTVSKNEQNEYGARQDFNAGIRTSTIEADTDGENIQIILAGSGKLYKGTVTANNEIPTLAEAIAASASSAVDSAASAAASAASAVDSEASAVASAASAVASDASATAASGSASAASGSAIAAAASAATAASYAAKIASLIIYANTQEASVGDGVGNLFFRIPSALNGFNLTGVAAAVSTAGTTGTLDIQIHNITQAVDMLTTKITIDSGETDSSTAATPAVIDTANDDVATGDKIRVDIDAVHSGTASQGLVVELRFEAP